MHESIVTSGVSQELVECSRKMSMEKETLDLDLDPFPGFRVGMTLTSPMSGFFNEVSKHAFSLIT